MSKDKLIPTLRFPEFVNEGEWEEKILGIICDVRDGTHDSPKYVSDGYPLITSKNLLENGEMDFDNVSYITKKDYEKINQRSKVDINDILFGMIGTIGNPVLVKRDGFAIKNVALIKGKGELNHEFLLFLMKSDYITKQFQKANAGGILKFVALGLIRKLTIPTPSPNEQQKIASCLSSLDELIVAHNDKLVALKDHKKGLMQNLFPTNSITNYESSITSEDEQFVIRNSQTRNLPKYRFKEFENDGEWEVKSIGSIAKVSAGGTPTSTEPKYWGGNIPWMNSGELNLKKVNSVANYITQLGLKESSTKKIPPLCVLIGLAGQGKTRGTAAINYIELCTNQSIAAIHPNKANFESEFLYHKIDSMYKTLRRLSTGQGGRGGLNLSIIREIEITFPSVKEQQKIASCLSALDELITAQAEKIEQLQLHKKGLMQGLFPKSITN